MKVTQYNINNYVKGINGFGLEPCSQIYSATLAADTPETVTVPSIAALGCLNSTLGSLYVAIFSYEPATTFYVAFNATAAVPAGGTFAATTSELNPKARIVKGGDVISVVAPEAASSLSISFYAIQQG
jgi:hypothetical protein